MDNRFRGKTVVITGASKGVGAATARRFAAAGARLVLAARGKKQLEALGRELRPKTDVLLSAMDVSDLDACISLFRKAEYEFEHIHFLVNSAGFHACGPVESRTADELGRMIDVNLKAPIQLCRLVIPYLKTAGGGAIINVASLAGRMPVPNAATCSASKFGLRVFTFALAQELRGTGIKLAAVSPGPIDTGYFMNNIDSIANITFSQPMSTVDEVATVIMDLAVNNSRERSMPPVSGLLTTMSYLLPWLGRVLQPMLDRRGRRVKLRLKRQFRAAETKTERTQ